MRQCFLSLSQSKMKGRYLKSGFAIGTLVATGLGVQASAFAQETSPSPSMQAQALSGLTPGQVKMIQPLLRQAGQNQGGDIRGFVEALLPSDSELREVILPNAQVYIQTPAGAIERSSVSSTNIAGRFQISALPSGSYNICAAAQGFTTECESISVANQNAFFPQPISLRPLGRVIRGCVSLADGTPAVRTATSAYQTAGAAEISVVLEGQVLAGPVSVNAFGCYVLPNVPDRTNLSITARYEQSVGQQTVAAQPSGEIQVVNVVLPDVPPAISGFAGSLNGTVVSEAPPGAQIVAKVEATSATQYPLHYTWADSTGASIPGDQSSVTWQLPRTNSTNLLFVEVSDGHGGIARASLPMLTNSASSQRPIKAPKAPTWRFNLLTGPTGLSTKLFPNKNQLFINPATLMGCALSRQQDTCTPLAQSYYQSYGVFDANNKPLGAYVNFKAWKAAWGFSNNPTTPGVKETRAVYYNNQDLGLGRDMHCLAPSGVTDPATKFPGSSVLVNVCYVTNYSDTGHVGFGANNPQNSVGQAETNAKPIATVAMVATSVVETNPPNSNNPTGWTVIPDVLFVVFTPPNSSDSNADDFQPNVNAVLDSQGPKLVPGVCMACHGGTYIGVSNRVARARFLPFDTPLYIFDQSNAHFSVASQSEAFRTLNVIVRNADTDGEEQASGAQDNALTSQTIRDLIAGWYSWCGGVDNSGCSIDDVGHPFIPNAKCISANSPATCGWLDNPLFGLAYQQVPRTVCRTCHVANSDVFNWQNFAYFQGNAASVCIYVNTLEQMPFAEVPYNQFWGNSLDQGVLSSLLVDVSSPCTLKPPT